MTAANAWKCFAHFTPDQLVVVHGANAAVLGRILAVKERSSSVAILPGEAPRPRLQCGDVVRLVDRDDRALEALVERVEFGEQATIHVRTLQAEEARLRPMPAGSREARDFRRVTSQRLVAQLSVVRIGKAARFRVELLDLSGGGARLLCSQFLRARENVRMHLPAIAGAAAWNGNARIVWAGQAGSTWTAGLQFVDLTAADRENIQRLVFRLRWQRDPALSAG